MVHRAYKFRIYPDEHQESVLRQTIGSCRYVYNWGLAKRTESWVKETKSMSYAKSCKALTLLKAEIDWLNDVSAVTLQQSLQNLDTAFTNFFKKRGRYPKFKKRKNGGSARYQSNGFRLTGNTLHLAKIKTPIRVVWSRDLPSEPSSCTVSQNPSGQWFVSFLCETQIEAYPKTDKRVGIDLGIETFATFSDGRKVSQPKAIRALRRKLARASRSHSRKKIGSKNREKSRLRVARVHQRIANIRTDFLHKLSSSIVRENQTIAIEDLAVSKMVTKRHLASPIGEQGWRDFRTMLEYKAKWRGRELVVVDRFFPSSKTCSCCGKPATLTLKDRVWSCSCGTTHDRDVNAARNILAAGMVVSACGVDGRPIKGYALNGNRQRSRKPKARASESPSLAAR